ncbi:MAG: phosphatase PAP2 family protein [Candidatus Cloacimonetes bacterium]|nr:phosphatase PAP2 family protein [Candidatus Cloacimonadota bacterium]
MPLLLLTFGTTLFQLTDLDLALQRSFFDSRQAWHLGELAIFKLVYHYGNIPALLIAVASLLLFALSYSRQRFLKYRKMGLYLTLCMLLGPGLLVNSILKENWGRPRPRELIEFGGKYEYEKPLTIDKESSGKSFPCGHATMGFYFFALYFLLRGKNDRRKLLYAHLFLILGLFYGTWIGIARMAQGGHFASDVLWAGALIYLSSFLIHRALGMQMSPYYQSRTADKPKLKLWQKLIFSLIAVLLIIGVLLATPYRSEKDFPITYRAPIGMVTPLKLNLESGDLVVTAGTQPAILKTTHNGHGFPGSKLKTRHRAEAADSKIHNSFSQNRKGFFTELVSQNKLFLSANSSFFLEASIKEGDISLDSLAVKHLFGLSLHSERGDIELVLPRHFKHPLILEAASDTSLLRSDLNLLWRQNSTPESLAFILSCPQGTLSIR